MPTEEIFSAPHRAHVDGYVRTSRPSFPMQREVNDAWFRFVAGQVVDYSAGVGQDVIQQFFAIQGADRLGEVALVDSTSPVFQSGLLFKSILFDENAACHFAFGEAYPECVEASDELSRAELAALGVNQAETHVDFMIGTATMNVTGICADGNEVAIMAGGRFAPAVVGG
jgi:aminopeptidase